MVKKLPILINNKKLFNIGNFQDTSTTNVATKGLSFSRQILLVRSPDLGRISHEKDNTFVATFVVGLSRKLPALNIPMNLFMTQLFIMVFI